MPPQSVNDAIRSYRLYFLDDGDRIARAHDIDSTSDAEACDRAAMMLREQSNFPCIEVWERARKVCRHP